MALVCELIIHLLLIFACLIFLGNSQEIGLEASNNTTCPQDPGKLLASQITI
jgi:hypothetical protein